MKEKLTEIKKDGLEKIEKSQSMDELQEVRKELMGKKSGLSEILKSMSSLSVDEKKEIPPEPNEGYSISINYNGKIFARKFNSTDKIGDIINFVKSEIPTFSEIQLFTVFPRKIFDDKNKTLIQAGLSKAEVIMAKIL